MSRPPPYEGDPRRATPDTSNNPRTADFRGLEWDDEAVYGVAFALDDGDFVRDAHGRYRERGGAEMVAQELRYLLLTPKGDDPFRSELGLDEFRFAGRNNAETRAAIIDCIGPDADARVNQIEEIDINIPTGNREEATVMIRLTLDDEENTPVVFRLQFEDMLRTEGVRNRDTRAERRAQRRSERRARNRRRREQERNEAQSPSALAEHQEAERHGFGYEFGIDFGE